MRWTIAEKLEGVSLPHMVRVTLNASYMGEINSKFLSAILDGLTYEVGAVVTLTEAWDMFDFDPIVLFYSESGWIGGSGYVVNSIKDEPSVVIRQTAKYSRALSEYKYAKSERRWSGGSFTYSKRVEAKASRRMGRAMLEEAMSEVY